MDFMAGRVSAAQQASPCCQVEALMESLRTAGQRLPFSRWSAWTPGLSKILTAGKFFLAPCF